MNVDTNRVAAVAAPAVLVRMKLATLWTCLMFMYVYVDILSLYKPGTVEDILVGKVWEFDISQGWAFGALALMTVPILMIYVSVTARAVTCSAMNVVVGVLYAIISIGSALGEPWVYFFGFGALVEVALLVVVIRSALTWRGELRRRSL